MKTPIRYALAIICLMAESALATRFINFEKEASQIDTVYDDDIFLSGFKVKFDSKVYGDLFSFSYEMVQSDTIEGNFMGFARSIQNLGPVSGSLRGFAQTLSCNSTIGRNLLLSGQDINIGPGTHVGRDADLWGANIVFQGATDGDLKISGHTAVVSGIVGKNLFFRGDSLTINPNTVIHGDLNYDSPIRATIGDAVTINGEVNWKKSEEDQAADKDEGGFWAALTWLVSMKGFLVWNIVSSLLVLIFILIPFPTWLVVFIFWFILVASGNVTLLLTKHKLYSTEKVLTERLFPSMGLGFIIFFLIPIISVVLFFTLLLTPLALALTMMFGVAVFIGGIYVNLFIGRRICMLFSRGAKNSPGYLCFTIGMTVLLLLSAIPVLGYLIVFVSLMTGVGALLYAIWRPAQQPAAEAVAVAGAN